MPAFHYIAKRLSGQTESGTVEAPDRMAGLRLLSAQSLLPTQLVEVREPITMARLWRGAQSPALASRVLAGMFDQLSHLLESGVPLLKAIEVLRDQASNPEHQAQITNIYHDVARGRSLADALQAHSATYGDLVISLVRAGEEGGFLEDSLERIARLLERQADLRQRVLGAVTYPLFLLAVGGVVVTGMMVFFVPKFAPLFERLRQRGELPIATRLLLSVSQHLQQYGVCWLLLAMLALWGLRPLAATPAAREWIDRQKISVWGIGPIFRSLALSRFCRVLGTLIKNGVPLLKSLRIAKDATGNRPLARAFQQAADNVSSGKSLVGPLRASGQVPRELLEMIAVGETANRLDSVLIGLADRLDLQTQRQIDAFVKLLEPCLMLVMALLIGFLVIALLLPVFASHGL